MDRELAEMLVQVLEDDGIDAELYESYSGRGMYGKETTGVVLKEGDVTDMITAVINNATVFVQEEEEPVNFFDLCEKFSVRNIRQDSLGLGVIIY